MERLDGISAKILDNLDGLIRERINSNYTKNYHQDNLFEGGLTVVLVASLTFRLAQKKIICLLA